MRRLLALGLLVIACSSSETSFDGAPDGESGGTSAGGGASDAGRSNSAGSIAAGGASSAEGGTTTPGGKAGASSSAAGSSLGGSGGAPSAAGTGGTTAPIGGDATGGASAAGAPVVGGEGGTPDSGGAAGAAGSADDCVCNAGECCDGCHYLPKTHFCRQVVRTAACLQDGALSQDYWNLFCGGDSTECTRWGAHIKYVDSACPAHEECAESDDQASCVTSK